MFACAGWPVVTRVCGAPRWLFCRLAIRRTLVLWLPDLYIWYKGENGAAVGVLAVRHVAIARGTTGNPLSTWRRCGTPMGAPRARGYAARHVSRAA